MDVLSRLFEEMHLHDVQYLSVHAVGLWQLKQPKQAYLTFIVVTKGIVYLEYAGQIQPISSNNTRMLTVPDGYVCKPETAVSNVNTETLMPSHQTGQQTLHINCTADSNPQSHADSKSLILTEFIIVRCRFDEDMAKPLLTALPASLPPASTEKTAYNKVVDIGVQFFKLEASLQRPGKTTMLERLASMLMIECIREYVENLNRHEAMENQRNQIKGYAKHPLSTYPYSSRPINESILRKVIPNSKILTDNTIDNTMFNRNEGWQLNSNKDMDWASLSSQGKSGNWLTALKDPALAKALYLIHSYPEASWKIVDLAKECGVSRSTFNERFKKIIGTTPQHYLSQYRLRLAARFLREQQYSISKISELVGYASDTSFHGAFKRQYHLSPSQYRKAYMLKS